MDLSTGPEVPASGTGPSHARYTAGRTHGSSLNASQGVSDIQPPDTDQQLASTETSNVEGPAPNTGRSPSLDRGAGYPGRVPNGSGRGESLQYHTNGYYG